MKFFIFPLSIALILSFQLHAQDAISLASAVPVTDTNVVVANLIPTNPTPPANLAPDDVIKKLSNLIHAGKYTEAQQLTSGLLLAYPDDQRLIKGKTLLEKLLAASTSINNEETNNSQPMSNGIPRQLENAADEIVGVGMLIRPDPSSHKFEIISVVPNSPAAQAGLSSGLVLDKIDGFTTQDKSLTEAANLIKGVSGTKVKLALINPDTKEVNTVELTRQKIQLANDTNPAQLTGMDKVEYNSLIELARQAQQNTDLEQQNTLLKQFMTDSTAFVNLHPKEMLLWQLRAASALSLNYPDAGYDAGQKLLASGQADNDPKIQQILAQLNLKGWLDKQKADARQKFGWVLGVWKMSWHWQEMEQHSFTAGQLSYGGIAEDKMNYREEFLMTNSGVEGYQLKNNGTRRTQPNLRGTFLNTGDIKWEYFIPAADSENMVFRYWWQPYKLGSMRLFLWTSSEKLDGRQFYPSGWQPLISLETGSGKTQIKIVIPLQTADSKSDKQFKFPVTLIFEKPSDSQDSLSPAINAKPAAK